MAADTEIPARIIAAATSEPHRKRARAHFKKLAAGSIFDDRSRTGAYIRGSDAGSCALATWANIHELEDIKPDGEARLSRLDSGLLFGAWSASLYGASIELDDKGTIAFEEHAEFLEVRISIDLSRLDKPHTYEFKWTFSGKAIDVEADHYEWILQAAEAACAKSAPEFSLIAAQPSRKKDRITAWTWPTERWAKDVVTDVARLRHALRGIDHPPEPQPGWLCKYCRYSACAIHPDHGDRSRDRMTMEV